jgi:hypothetical protein
MMARGSGKDLDVLEKVGILPLFARRVAQW